MRQRFRRKPDQAVTAIRLAFETAQLSYHKWGHAQQAVAGDWLVDNNGDVYTIEAASFAATYRQVGPGRWVKTAPVWAERATGAGLVATKEGQSAHVAGDWLVSNGEDGSDAYVVSDDTFTRLYEPDPDGAGPG